MNASATGAVAEHESAPIAHRQGRLIDVVAERHSNLRRPQEQLVLQPVAQFVLRVGNQKIGRRVAPRTALDRNHVKPGFGQLVRKN